MIRLIDKRPVFIGLIREPAFGKPVARDIVHRSSTGLRHGIGGGPWRQGSVAARRCSAHQQHRHRNRVRTYELS